VSCIMGFVLNYYLFFFFFFFFCIELTKLWYMNFSRARLPVCCSASFCFVDLQCGVNFRPGSNRECASFTCSINVIYSFQFCFHFIWRLCNRYMFDGQNLYFKFGY
jgi:hypothetical protein